MKNNPFPTDPAFNELGKAFDVWIPLYTSVISDMARANPSGIPQQDLQDSLRQLSLMIVSEAISNALSSPDVSTFVHRLSASKLGTKGGHPKKPYPYTLWLEGSIERLLKRDFHEQNPTARDVFEALRGLPEIADSEDDELFFNTDWLTENGFRRVGELDLDGNYRQWTIKYSAVERTLTAIRKRIRKAK